MISLMHQFDNSILQFIQNNMHGPFMDKFMIFVTRLGNLGTIWIIIAVFLIITKKYRNAGIATLCAVILGAVLGEGIIKHIVQRPRPFVESGTMNLLISRPLSSSFPSGHTTAAFAAAAVLSRYFKRYAAGFFVLAFLIAFSRLYLYVHYPTDVLAGIVLGLLCSKIVFYMLNVKCN
ncbi:phosphatase PAP2 family protein [Clostridium sp. Mt-5]|uniref:Phosphatase PAP2 family protein n=1 Tax=Clostridium moutaii TaxID=3240932 RepID=A0ABV4BJC5_9CLOT